MITISLIMMQDHHLHDNPALIKYQQRNQLTTEL